MSVSQLTLNLVEGSVSFRFTPEAAREDWYGHPLLQALAVSKQKQVYFLDYHPFGRIRGPLAARLMVDQLQQTRLTRPRGTGKKVEGAPA